MNPGGLVVPGALLSGSLLMGSRGNTVNPYSGPAVLSLLGSGEFITVKAHSSGAGMMPPMPIVTSGWMSEAGGVAPPPQVGYVESRPP